ncbi:MAG: radical SAM protein, partial [Planctomycetota bacterium]
MADKKEYLFGPVPSRRLGLSLGVDIVPFKFCTQDCIYCQLGRTTKKTIERQEYVPVEPVMAELREKIAEGLKADYITISGSGEPTLNLRIGEFISQIKKITDIPVAVLTNGTLFTQSTVRGACALADLVVPSLDAGDEETFQKIDRPHEQLNLERIIDGLCRFREEFRGQIWLEVFLIEGVNTGTEQISKIKDAVAKIQPDKVQLNTAVRPTADAGVERISPERLRELAAQLGHNCEIVADFSTDKQDTGIKTTAKSVLSMLKRRPCSVDDICS